MLQHRDPPHLLASLKTTTTPKRLLWLDCYALRRKDHGAWVHRWHVGCLGSTHYTSRKKERVDNATVHDSPLALWQQVNTFCTPNRRVVLWAYDLALQLRVSQGLVHLPAMGWQLERIVLERSAAWAAFKRGKQSLLMCDLRSWAPVDFNRFAADVHYGPETEYVFKAGPGMRGEQCRWKCAVIRDSVLQILGWIEAENLGPFRPTGSGQSYAAFRRRFNAHPLLVHDDGQQLGAERAAMWTGRCEAWRHGPLMSGPYVEYDMQAAYCAIARDCEVPTQVHRKYEHVTTARLERLMDSYAVLAKLEVTTDVPCLPARMGSRTAWPVGSFRTWVWDPEIRLALENYAHVSCLEAYTYHRAGALRGFASWVLDGMGEQTQVYGLVPKRVLKHWSRCLVGRLGLRYRAWEKFATAEHSDLRLVNYADCEDGTITDLLIAGREWLILTDMQEAQESLPQVPSWVMSECRRRLWKAMLNVGLGNIVYVDTDSMVTTAAGARRWEDAHGYDGADGWTIKGQYDRMHIHGPRNYTAQDVRRVAGLPKTARQVAPLEFDGTVMRSIKESMRAGELDCVVDIPRRFVLNAPDLRRQHVPGGRTIPFEVSLQPNQED